MRPTESFVEQPVRSLQTMLRVLAEADRSLPTVVPDGVYGPGTSNAVSAIQRREGLPVSGVTDQATWNTIVQNYEPALIQISKAQPIEVVLDPNEILRNGDSGPYIYLLQSVLMQLSRDYAAIHSPTLSGTFDDDTGVSLGSFQQLAGLPVTEELDKITWKYLVHHFSLNAVQNKKRIL